MNDTIAAIATPPGRGGVGIIRVSGPGAHTFAEQICQLTPKPRYAHYVDFSHQDRLIDQGLLLYFPGPNSFTGEDICEFQCHGGPVVLDQLLSTLVSLGARLARPGEFSERAFLNDKIDLAQAEAIADLIDASSQQAARNAVASLQGTFSKAINELVEELTHLRLYVEAAIDFPEEEIDFLQDQHIQNQLGSIDQRVQSITQSTQQGIIIREGLNVVIAGQPNAGKSSLLNALAGTDRAIVTDIAGTTRDSLSEHIHIDGLPLHITDTAGIRDTEDPVEKIGVERARKAVAEADLVLVIIDNTRPETHEWQPLFEGLTIDSKRLCIIANKVDQCPAPTISPSPIAISAKTGQGLDQLKNHIKQLAGLTQQSEHQFTARQRHLDAINRAAEYVERAKKQLCIGAGELLAQDLLDAQQALGEITGKVSADDLLGRIFSSFCIGK